MNLNGFIFSPVHITSDRECSKNMACIYKSEDSTHLQLFTNKLGSFKIKENVGKFIKQI